MRRARRSTRTISRSTTRTRRSSCTRRRKRRNLDLKNGRLDYILADKLALNDFIDGQGKDCCKFVSDIKRDPTIHGPGVAAAFRKEDAALGAMISKAIEESIKDGTHKAIMDKYFKVNILVD